MRTGKLMLVCLVLVLGGFVFGLGHLFRLRFQTGDVYPEYSTLRADPLGSKALFDSFAPLRPARRHYQPLSKLGPAPQTTLFYLGAQKDDLYFAPSDIRELELFISKGGRMVVSLYPRYQKPRSGVSKPVAGTNAPPAGRKGAKRGPADESWRKLQPVELTDRWGFQIGYAQVEQDEKEVYKPRPAQLSEELPLPAKINCHTAAYFEKLDPAWKTVYTCSSNQAVLVERKLGQGSIVIFADSFYCSNEGLLDKPQPALLAWLAGPGHRIIFDETHLGVEDSAGIATLARKYRLHGLFAGLLLLAGLFVWKSSVSFLPAAGGQTEGAAELVTGRDAAAGFLNLLRRNIRPAELLAVCLGEWKKSCARQISRNKLEQIQTAIDLENSLPAKQHDPIKTYHTIHRILTEKKFHYER